MFGTNPWGQGQSSDFPPKPRLRGGMLDASFRTRLNPPRLGCCSDAFSSFVIKGFGDLNSGCVPIPTPRLVCDWREPREATATSAL